MKYTIYTASGKQNPHKVSELVHSLQSVYPNITFSFSYKDDFTVFTLSGENHEPFYYKESWIEPVKQTIKVWMEGYAEGKYIYGNTNKT